MARSNSRCGGCAARTETHVICRGVHQMRQDGSPHSLVLAEQLACPSVDEVQPRAGFAYDGLIRTDRLAGDSVVQPVLYVHPGSGTSEDEVVVHGLSVSARTAARVLISIKTVGGSHCGEEVPPEGRWLRSLAPAQGGCSRRRATPPRSGCGIPAAWFRQAAPSATRSFP